MVLFSEYFEIMNSNLDTEKREVETEENYMESLSVVS